MKVARTIPAFYPMVSGPINQAFEISNRLEKRGHRSPIFTTNHKAREENKIERLENVKVKRHSIAPFPMKYSLALGLPISLMNANADLIHAHSYRNFPADASAMIQYLEDIPFVLQSHGSFTGYKHIVEGRWRYAYDLYDVVTRKMAARCADAIVVSSTQEMEDAKLFGIPPKKIFVIPVGSDIGEYRKYPREPPTNHYRVLFVGRISRNRNVEQIIQAISELPNNYSLRIVGEEAKSSDSLKGGYVNELNKLSEELGITDRVHFVGAKYDDDLIHEYRSAHLFVYTSKYENFGQTILEAASAGLPIVSTPEGVANDIVKDGETGYLVPYGNSNETAKAIQRVIRGDLRRFSENILSLVENEFSWSEIINDYIGIYNKLVE